MALPAERLTGIPEPRAGGQSAARAVTTPAHLLPGMPPRQRPAEALEALARQIPGPGRFYICSDGVLGVLSLPAVSVWSNGRVLSWRDGDGEMTWPAADAPGAARRLHAEIAAPVDALPPGVIPDVPAG